jgi:hypothetical protein
MSAWTVSRCARAALRVCFVLAVCGAAWTQRIAGITTIEATLDYSNNDPLDDGTGPGGTTTRQTTVLDVFVRPELDGDTAFRFNVTTLSTSGTQGTDLCDAPSSDGQCAVATPMSVRISSSKLMQRYELRLRRAIPYLYYHRRFITCDGFTLDLLTSTDKGECYNAERYSAAERAECLCRGDRLNNAPSNGYPFAAPDVFRYSFANFDPVAATIDRVSSRSSLLDENVVLRDYARNASLYFNAVERSESTGAEYTPPAPGFDADGDTLYFLSHLYDATDVKAGVSSSTTSSSLVALAIQEIGRVRSNYVGRATGPLCYVYDINAIPEQVLHVTVEMTPDNGDTSRTQTLELSTVNEANGARFTSGSSRNAATQQSGAFTARIENLQSPTSSFGPSLTGSIVMCADGAQDSRASFINTIPVDTATDVTQNPWRSAFQDNPEDARGRVFDAETISLLRNQPGQLSATDSRAGIYYYSAAETNTVGEDCGQVGVTNRVYAGVPPQIANLVTSATVRDVSLDLIRGNESARTALPSCFPGFGPSVGRDTPLPGRMLARQRMYRDELDSDPSAFVPQPPHVPPVYNARDPNVYFADRFMYYEPPGASDVEVELIITVSGSFLSVTEQRSAGSITDGSSFCAVRVLKDTGETVGALSALVCNDAERVQAPATGDNATDATADDAAIRSRSAQFGVQAECPEDSGVRVKGTGASSASQIVFTGILEPGVCERVFFDLVLLQDTLDPNLAVCNIELISTSAPNNPSEVFLDRARVGCSLTNDYEPPPTTDEGDIDTTLSAPPGPDLLDEDDSVFDHLGALIMGMVIGGLLLVMGIVLTCMCCNYYILTSPQLSKYI